MTKKHIWSVRVPMSGFVVVEVEATSEEQAIEAALESDDLIIANIEQCDFHAHIVRGNVFYGILNEPEAEDLGAVEEEAV